MSFVKQREVIMHCLYLWFSLMSHIVNVQHFVSNCLHCCRCNIKIILPPLYFLFQSRSSVCVWKSIYSKSYRLIRCLLMRVLRCQVTE